MLHLLKTVLLCSLFLAMAPSCKVSPKNKDTEQDQNSTGSTSNFNSPTDEVQTSGENNIGDQPSGNESSSNLLAPIDLDDNVRSSSLTDTPTIDWDSVTGASGYEIAIGTTSGGTEILDWTSVGTSLSHSASGLTLQNGEMYYASVRAVATDGTKGPISSGDGWQNLECPPGYIKIPGNETANLGGSVYPEGTKSNYDWSNDPTTATARKISDFCVMKYEAKDGGSHTATSIAAGFPWVSIQREQVNPDDDAQEACENNGASYELIGNHHWQAIARNIELVASNFDTTGATIDHTFNRGHADAGPNNALAADSNDDNGCIGVTSNGNPADNCGLVWHINKRTHTLTNNLVIWDFSGNVLEWIRDDITTLQTSGGNDYIQNDPYTDALAWGPTNSYSSQTGTDKAGLGYFNDGTINAVLRGGSWSSGDHSGLFFTDLSSGFLLGPDDISSYVGFRCVFVP